MADTIAVRPPFDPESAEMLPQVPGLFKTLWPDQIDEVRSLASALKPDPVALRRGGAVRLTNRSVPGPEGAPEVELLILSPAQGSGPWPLLYYIHGGGMIMGDRYLSSEVFAERVETLGVVVVSVEYRLAPENPHPAPVEDCYAGLRWAADHAEELGIDPDRIILYGSSAGGGLAAATALLARDRGGPRLSHQILQAPMLDDRMTTVSSQMLDGEGLWDKHCNRTGWTALLGSAVGGPDVSPYAAPARAEDLSGLPPAYIDVGAVETFRDEVIDYAARLSQAGVPVDLHVWSGAFHGSDSMAPQAAISRAANEARQAYLRRAIG